MRNKEEKRKAEQVERYIDQDAAYTGKLDDATERVVNTLHQAASETRPRPGFINELANQLREQETIMSDKSTRNFWGIASRLLLGGAAVAAVAVFALYLAGLFGSPSVEPAVSENDLPPRPELEVAGGQHFPNAEFEVMTTLSEEAGEVPLYTAQQAPLPATLEEARALGERFGLEAPTVYESPSDPGRWIVMGANGRNISFRINNPGLDGLSYSAGAIVPLAAVEGEPVDAATAEAAAIAFLEAVDMLPEAYEIEVVEPAGSPARNVRVSVILDGHPLRGQPAPIEVGVGPQGDILHARINLLDPEPAGESVPVKSAAQAFTELVEGTSPSMSYSFEQRADEASGQIQYFNPPGPEHTPGEEVEIVGWVNVLVPVAEGEIQATLHLRSGSAYQLEGSAVTELADAPSQSAVLVEGTIGEALGPKTWSLVVESIEPAAGNVTIECLTGHVRREGNSGLLETDEGERFSLAYTPENLESGARAEVCAENFTTEEPVAWLHIQSPPSREMPGGGGGGGGGSVSVAVETVEEVAVTRTVIQDAEPADAPTPVAGGGGGGGGNAETAPADSGSGGGGGGGGAAPAPAAEPGPYQPGEIVELTGIVEGVIFEEEGRRTYQMTLRQGDGADEELFFVYPLLGDPQILEQLTELHRLHVRVTGQIVPAPADGQSGTHGLGLVVQSFERANPDEEIVTFLGQLEQATVEGEARTIFIDEASGDRYMLNHPLNLGQQPADRRVWLAGVVEAEETLEGLPLLRTYSSRSGSDVDAAESPEDLDFTPGMQVIEQSEMRREGLEGTLIVERVVLGYTYAPPYTSPRPEASVPAGEEPVSAEPVTLQPTWFFYGHTKDGNIAFTIQVPATTVDDGGGRQ